MTKFDINISYNYTGDMMNKKLIIAIVITIILAMTGAKLVYDEYQEYIEGSIDYNSYLIQQGVYTTKDALTKGIEGLTNYIISEENNKYYVYLGVTTSMNNAKKIKSIYENQEILTSIKPTVIDNIEFISNLEQYDVLLDGVNSDKDILSINYVILSDYEELIQKK